MRRVALLQYYLSSVNFHHEDVVRKSNRNEVCVFVIELQDTQIERGSQIAEAFYQATYLTKWIKDGEEAKEGESNLSKFCSYYASAVELQFRATDLSGHIIQLNIDLDSLKVKVSSYFWRKNKRSYIKCESEEKVKPATILDLLNRIYIKKENKILHLTQGNLPILNPK